MDQGTQTDIAQGATQGIEKPAHKGCIEFVRGVFSDDGQPSSSRVLTFILAIAVVVFLSGIIRHICKITDTTALGLWLTNLPLIIAALVGLMAAPYTINRASGSISDIIASLRKTS